MRFYFERTLRLSCCLLAIVALACGAPRTPPAGQANNSGAVPGETGVGTEPSDARAGTAAGSAKVIRVQILAFNDFHGQIIAGRTVDHRPVGSAPVLAAYLEEAAEKEPTIIVHAGDLVGASPPESGLLQDEPSMMWVNQLGNGYCVPQHRMDPRCNLVGIVGNHEFDEGFGELIRMIRGGNYKSGPFLENPYSGAHFPYVCANVVHTDNMKPVLPPFVIKKIAGVPIGFIGAVVRATPSLVNPAGIEGLTFLDEADAINRYARQLQKRGVEAIVAVIHQGGVQTPYDGSTRANDPKLHGRIVDVVAALDDSIDVVISGHTHEFTNALVRNRHGVPILVTQAWAKSVAYGDIDLGIDPRSLDVVTKTARIVTAWADAGPGLTPDPKAVALVKEARRLTGPIINRTIADAARDIVREPNAAGESALGDLIADAQRSVMGTDFAFMNPGGIRSDIKMGRATWGDLYEVQPFGDPLVKMELTGKQIYDLLSQQWSGQPEPRILQVSGLTYVWAESRPEAGRIVEVRKEGRAIDPIALYTVTVNKFLADGGDHFTVLTEGKNRSVGGKDLDALIQYVKSLPQPFDAVIDGRIGRIE